MQESSSSHLDIAGEGLEGIYASILMEDGWECLSTWEIEVKSIDPHKSQADLFSRLSGTETPLDNNCEDDGIGRGSLVA